MVKKRQTILAGNLSNKIIPDIKAWQSRPLDPIYCIVWLDTMHYKVRVDGKIVHRTLYNILGVNKAGYKEVMGLIFGYKCLLIYKTGDYKIFQLPVLITSKGLSMLL